MKSDEEVKEQAPISRQPESVMPLLAIDPLELEIGYGLLSFADEGAEDGGLLRRVTMVRRQIALELGLVLPHVRIRDNIQLPPTDYAIKIHGIEIARGEVMVGHYLAMDPGIVTQPVPGIEAIEPAFGLPALWITETEKERAEMAGYTVVDPVSVIVTHLTEIIRRHAAELLGRQDTANLIENVRKTEPAVVDELIPNLMTIGEVQRVLQNLLREGVSIRNTSMILEALGDYAGKTRDPDILTEYARASLARVISRQYRSPNGEIVVATVDPAIEEKIARLIEVSRDTGMTGSDLDFSQAVVSGVAGMAEKMAREGINQ